MTPVPDRPIEAPSCPICGEPNGCTAAASGSFDTPCWCQSLNISADVLARVPDELRGLACVCRACTEGTPLKDPSDGSRGTRDEL